MEPIDFIRENNLIEGIIRDPDDGEIAEYQRFLDLSHPTVKDLETFVSIYEPGVQLRTRLGMNVSVGSHIAPVGGAYIWSALEDILERAIADTSRTYETHLAYENLHPFTDCNGRSGRMLWLWQMGAAPLGFLHTFYYQTLEFEHRILDGSREGVMIREYP